MSAPTVPYLVDTAGWVCESCATGTDCPCWSWACTCRCQAEEIRHAGAESRHAAADMRTDGSDLGRSATDLPASRPGYCRACGGPTEADVALDEDLLRVVAFVDCTVCGAGAIR